MGPEELFAGHPLALTVFFRVRSVLEQLGPVDIRTTKSQVAFFAVRAATPTSGCPASTLPTPRRMWSCRSLSDAATRHRASRRWCIHLRITGCTTWRSTTSMTSTTRSWAGSERRRNAPAEGRHRSVGPRPSRTCAGIPCPWEQGLERVDHHIERRGIKGKRPRDESPCAIRNARLVRHEHVDDRQLPDRDIDRGPVWGRRPVLDSAHIDIARTDVSSCAATWFISHTEARTCRTS